MTRANNRNRRGVAAVEAALLLPPIMIFVLMLTMLGSDLNTYQLLQNSAQQGSRAAASLENSNAGVVLAVMSSLPSVIDQKDVTVRLTKLDENGDESYEIQNLNENEQGKLVKVTVDYSGGFGLHATGEDEASLSVSVITRREDLQ